MLFSFNPPLPPASIRHPGSRVTLCGFFLLYKTVNAGENPKLQEERELFLKLAFLWFYWQLKGGGYHTKCCKLHFFMNK